MSLFVDCDDQQQVDHLFERLHEGGQRSRRAVRSSSAAAHARVVFAHHHPEHARSQAVCKTSISGSNPDGASNSTLNPERAVCWLASRRVKSGRRLHLPEQGFYAWRRGPESTHTRRDRRLHVEGQGKRNGRPNLAHAGRRKRRDEGPNPGFGNGLNVIAVDRAGIGHPIRRVQQHFTGDVPNGGGHRGDGDFAEVRDDGVSRQDDDGAALVRLVEPVPADIAALPASPHCCSFSHTPNSSAPAGLRT